jgi:hypothetical protein
MPFQVTNNNEISKLKFCQLHIEHYPGSRNTDSFVRSLEERALVLRYAVQLLAERSGHEYDSLESDSNTVSQHYGNQTDASSPTQADPPF